MSRARGFCFTLNNWTEQEYASLQQYAQTARYAIFGKEVGEKGTPHIQGYIYFDGQKTFSSLTKNIPRGHILVAKGTPDENRKYCSKGGDFWEKGSIPEQGKRSDLESLAADVTSGKSIKEIAEGNPVQFIKFHRGVHALKLALRTEPKSLDGEFTNKWYYGESGTGKSRAARDRHPGVYVKDLTKWWDGYNDEEVVVIDDMDPFHKSFARSFKIWSDRYVFPAETKGGTMMIRPKTIIVTSQYLPEQIWDDAPTLDAINRRFQIEKF